MTTYIEPKISNGTELECLLNKCEGCSRNKWEDNWCNLQTAIMTGQMTETQAKHIGFDEQGNPPKELKCYRKYKRKFTDKKTGSLF
jgi:hypothetical protein